MDDEPLSGECIVTGDGDLAVEWDARPFINQRCKILKRTKAGLYQVALVANPKMTYSVPKRNVWLRDAQGIATVPPAG